MRPSLFHVRVQCDLPRRSQWIMSLRRRKRRLVRDCCVGNIYLEARFPFLVAIHRITITMMANALTPTMALVVLEAEDAGLLTAVLMLMLLGVDVG